MPASPHPAGQQGGTLVLEAAAVLAVGAAAVAFVAGTGTYLYIRFTQNRRKPSMDDEPPPRL
jgi:hypothetical protein